MQTKQSLIIWKILSAQLLIVRNADFAMCVLYYKKSFGLIFSFAFDDMKF